MLEKINMYTDASFLLNRQGTKRSRPLLENDNINTTHGNDKDSNGSESTQEAEFWG